jgi:iron complex outermembrane receptor protein
MTRKLLLLSGAVSALGLLGGVAHGAAAAANAGARDTNSGTTVGELVITAEKREQTLQTVPVAVSAYTAAERQLIGIDSIQDMSNFTPGLEYNSSTDRISLRGVGRLTNVLSADASVANYRDGIYESFAVQAGLSTIFLDRVEILRGPQGTLYGRNSIGGAINEISRRPTKEMYAEARVTYGNYDHKIIEGALSGPITDWLQFRVVGQWEKQGRGWIHEVVPGVSDEGNVINQENAEIQLQAQFSPKLEAWIDVLFQEWNNPGGGPGSQAGGWTPYPFDQAEYGPASVHLNSGYGCTAFATNVVNPSPLGCTNPAEKSPWLAARNEAWRVRLPDAYTTSFQLVYHASGFDIKYTTGGVHYNYLLYGPSADNLNNNFGAPITQYTLPGGLVIHSDNEFVYDQGENTWSHEINFISTTNSNIQWLAGLYYFFQKYTQPVYVVGKEQSQWNGPFGDPVSNRFVFCAQTGGVCAPSSTLRWYDNRPVITDQSAAAFTQVDWKFTPTLKTTLGIRYSTDEKYGHESVRLLCFGVPACYTFPEFNPFIPGGLPAVDLSQIGTVISQQPAPGVVGPTTFNPKTGFATRTFDGHWQAVTGTAGLEWTPDSDTLVYGKYSRGYKSGGFNIGIFTVISFYPYTAAEHVNSFEVGLKKTFFHTLTTDLAAFYYTYSNLQVPVTVVATGGGLSQNNTEFYNVPSSVSRGFEMETTWQPNRHFTLLVDYSFLDAYVTKGALPDSVDPLGLQPGAKPLPCTPATPCTPDIYTGGTEVWQNLAGNRLENAPKNKVAINGTYTFFFQPGSLSASVSYIWRDVQYGALFTRWYNAAPAWDEWDARLTFTAASGRWKVIAFGKNLFNTIGYDAGAYGTRMAGSFDGINPFLGLPAVNTVQSPAIDKTYSVTPPRTYGVEFDYKFF